METRKMFVMRNEVNNLENLTKEELKNYLSTYVVKNISGLSKEELIDKVLDTCHVNIYFGGFNTSEKRENKLVSLFDEQFKVCKEKDGIMYEYYYIDKELMNEHEGYEFNKEGVLNLNFDLEHTIREYQDYVYDSGLDIFIDDDIEVLIYESDDEEIEIEEVSNCCDRITVRMDIPSGCVQEYIDKMMTKDRRVILEGYYGLKRFVEEEVKSYLDGYYSYWDEEAEFQNEMKKNTITLEHASAKTNMWDELIIKNSKNEIVKEFKGYKSGFLFEDIKIEINNLYGEIRMKNYEKWFSHKHTEISFEKMDEEEFKKLKEKYDEK